MLPMKTILAAAAILIASVSFGQSSANGPLIDLAKTYSDFMFMNAPSKKAIGAIRSNASAELKTAAAFVAEAITSKNKLLTPAYLSLPEETVLKQLYVVQKIHVNLNSEAPMSNERLTDSLMAASIPRYELVDNYYSLLFTSCGNKNQPFNLSKVDFDLNAYNLKDETEKGIFFLQCMDLCGTTIWGYMNIPDPPNTKEAYAHIKKYPKFNGQPYFTYNDFFFPDFEMVIILDEEPKNYKAYYLNKYYETLLSHGVCLIEQKAPEEELNVLLLGSILRDQRLYKYTEYRETLEEIFQEQEE